MKIAVAFCHSKRVLLSSYQSKKLCFSCTYVRAKPPALHANAHTHKGAWATPHLPVSYICTSTHTGFFAPKVIYM